MAVVDDLQRQLARAISDQEAEINSYNSDNDRLYYAFVKVESLDDS